MTISDIWDIGRWFLVVGIIPLMRALMSKWEGDIVDLKKKDGKLFDELEDLKEQVSEVQTEVALLKQKTESTEKQVDRIESKVDEILTHLTNIRIEQASKK